MVLKRLPTNLHGPLMLDDADAYVQLTEEAVQWYQKSAEGGYAAAQHHMGLCHAKGDGVEQNWTQAARWFGLAAVQVRPGDVPLFRPASFSSYLILATSRNLALFRKNSL
jgi:hypothetical protein